MGKELVDRRLGIREEWEDRRLGMGEEWEDRRLGRKRDGRIRDYVGRGMEG